MVPVDFVTEEPNGSSLSVNSECGSTPCLLADDVNDVSCKDEETADRQLMTGERELAITDEERQRAMLAAMDVSSSYYSLHQLQQQPAMSVEACLTQFTDKELLCGANMITCENCGRAAVPACANNDDNSNSTANSGDNSSSSSSSSSKTNGTGAFDFVISLQ